jgi:hypothetical protein
MKITNKYIVLGICLLMDAIGMLTYLIPGIAETMDLVWAPISSMILYWLFGDKIEGKIGSLVSFAEELSIGFDFIPTFTIVWFLRFVIRKDQPNQPKG